MNPAHPSRVSSPTTPTPLPEADIPEGLSLTEDEERFPPPAPPPLRLVFLRGVWLDFRTRGGGGGGEDNHIIPTHLSLVIRLCGQALLSGTVQERCSSPRQHVAALQLHLCTWRNSQDVAKELFFGICQVRRTNIQQRQHKSNNPTTTTQK